ncbi:unnamed protein product [Nippostrongylus brasiliensis]|uniref:NTR domain-containing protein n=1 Tax=Nippostrongylus brasiliensis TaxID=27835 RepID=A0A0N4XDP9_NIPBR|nr:unnamed protein product [Nippostrongylus brasiliensis]
MVMIKVGFAFVSVIAVVYACKCRKLPSKEAFCNSDFVSHIKVTAVNKNGADSETPPQTVYTVTHVSILKIGKEYLIAGSCEDGSLHSGSCGQISPDKPEDSSFGVVMEWKDVSKKFLDQLNKYKC